MGQMMRRVHKDMGVTRPWDSVNAGSAGKKYVPVHHPDAQDEIDLCLNCEIPEEACHGNGGCYAISDGYRALRRRIVCKNAGRFDSKVFEEAQRAGLTRLELASLFSVTPRTITDWYRKYGRYPASKE